MSRDIGVQAARHAPMPNMAKFCKRVIITLIVMHDYMGVQKRGSGCNGGLGARFTSLYCCYLVNDDMQSAIKTLDPKN